MGHPVLKRSSFYCVGKSILNCMVQLHLQHDDGFYDNTGVNGASYAEEAEFLLIWEIYIELYGMTSFKA